MQNHGIGKALISDLGDGWQAFPDEETLMAANERVKREAEISNGALELLRDNGIEVTYSMTAIAISNRRGDGICPMERLVAPIRDAKAAYEKLREKVLSDN